MDADHSTLWTSYGETCGRAYEQMDDYNLFRFYGCTYFYDRVSMGSKPGNQVHTWVHLFRVMTEVWHAKARAKA